MKAKLIATTAAVLLAGTAQAKNIGFIVSEGFTRGFLPRRFYTAGTTFDASSRNVFQ